MMRILQVVAIFHDVEKIRNSNCDFVAVLLLIHSRINNDDSKKATSRKVVDLIKTTHLVLYKLSNHVSKGKMLLRWSKETGEP